jgi:DNA mismatch repair protein MutL
MSTRIHRLPRDVIEKIAAGEVIERPASVVKELVENALDAGANEIVVSIARGDDLRLSVADNGIGMSPDDALLAFERHATSKVREQRDLEALATLGFRGEALAAIAAVSEAEMVTAPVESPGTRVVMRGGECVECGSAARARGTTVRVSRLFFNTPARRKFMRREATEVRAIEREIIAHALAAEGIGFELVEDGIVRFRLPPGLPLDARLDAVFGGGTGEDFLRVEGRDAAAALFGFVAPPSRTRGLADAIFFAVNGRPIESRALQRALLQGFEPLLGPRRYPMAALALTIPHDRVDPNVHPTKREVRFLGEQEMFRLVRRSVARALNGAGLVPDFDAPIEIAGPATAGSSHAQPLPFAREATYPYGPPLGDAAYGRGDTAGAPAAAPGGGPTLNAAFGEAAILVDASGRSVLESLLAAPAILQAHRTYLVAESSEGLLLVDQHTAHERILFEEGLERIARKNASRQPLLVPATVDLPPGDARRVEEFADVLEALGFEIRAIGPTAFAVEAVPTERRGDDIARWLSEILENLARDASPQDRFVRAARSYACKTAVRAGDPLRPEEMRSLIARLARVENPFACPHGRPIVARVRLYDIERLFGRR